MDQAGLSAVAQSAAELRRTLSSIEAQTEIDREQRRALTEAATQRHVDRLEQIFTDSARRQATVQADLLAQLQPTDIQEGLIRDLVAVEAQIKKLQELADARVLPQELVDTARQKAVSEALRKSGEELVSIQQEVELDRLSGNERARAEALQGLDREMAERLELVKAGLLSEEAAWEAYNQRRRDIFADTDPFLQAFTVDLETLGAQAIENFGNRSADAFSDFLLGAQSGSDVMKQFAADLGAATLRMTVQAAQAEILRRVLEKIRGPEAVEGDEAQTAEAGRIESAAVKEEAAGRSMLEASRGMDVASTRQLEAAEKMLQALASGSPVVPETIEAPELIEGAERLAEATSGQDQAARTFQTAVGGLQTTVDGNFVQGAAQIGAAILQQAQAATTEAAAATTQVGAGETQLQAAVLNAEAAEKNLQAALQGAGEDVTGAVDVGGGEEAAGGFLSTLGGGIGGIFGGIGGILGLGGEEGAAEEGPTAEQQQETAQLQADAGASMLEASLTQAQAGDSMAGAAIKAGVNIAKTIIAAILGQTAATTQQVAGTTMTSAAAIQAQAAATMLVAAQLQAASNATSSAGGGGGGGGSPAMSMGALRFDEMGFADEMRWRSVRRDLHDPWREIAILHRGGIAREEGLALLQKGEVVTPAGETPGGNISISSSVTVTGSGGADTTAEVTGGEDAPTTQRRAEEFSRALDQVLVEFVRENQRPGGLLEGTGRD